MFALLRLKEDLKAFCKAAFFKLDFVEITPHMYKQPTAYTNTTSSDGEDNSQIDDEMYDNLADLVYSIWQHMDISYEDFLENEFEHIVLDLMTLMAHITQNPEMNFDS